LLRAVVHLKVLLLKLLYIPDDKNKGISLLAQNYWQEVGDFVVKD
jgi:hypothetical protein